MAIRAGAIAFVIAGIFDAAVCDNGNLFRALGHIHDGRQLRYADTSHHAWCRWNRADPDLDRIRAGVDQRFAASPVMILPAMI